MSSGLILDGDFKDLKMINVGKRKVVLAGVNDYSMKTFALKGIK